jgi:V/A-type H+-transporting ATPase subunit A
MLRLLAGAEGPSESQPAWIALQRGVLVLLRQAEELRQVASIIGPAALSDRQQWTLFAANLVREGFLQQNALDPVDSYCAPDKQLLLLLVFMDLHREAARLIDAGLPCHRVVELPSLPLLRRARTEIPDDQLARLVQLAEGIRRELAEAAASAHDAPSAIGANADMRESVS